MTNKKHIRRGLAGLLAVVMLFSLVPAAFAANQATDYHDPAEHWLNAAGRTNEFNVNATVSEGTMYCRYCTEQQNGSAGAEPHVFTPGRTFRVPEYTPDGVSNAYRNIAFSDGTMIDNESKSNVMYQSPNNGGIYTGYHWTKTMCLKCGRLNTSTSTNSHSYLLDVYALYDCASDFDQETLPESTDWECLDGSYHYKTTTTGTYCGFCFGTHKEKATKTEPHTMVKSIRSELSHDRFLVNEACSGCDFSKTSYVLAKSVAANYEGMADGNPHTIRVSDLSERGVTTAIRYGTSSDNCTLTSAPNYTEPGSYPVYYKITYTYQGTDMVEDGVAYVRLKEATDDSCPCGCGDPDCGCQDANCGGNCCGNPCSDHSFTQLDKVAPSCNSIGYTRYLCVGCGKIEKRDYTSVLDHSWQSIVIRDATCEADGKVLEICARCGEVNTKNTAKGEHQYSTHTVKATCTNPGYIVKECGLCGDRHVTDITNALPHDYKAIVTPAGCETGGSTLHLCEGCGSSFVTDYTDALGHSWDNGTAVTDATCSGEGVTEYRCVRCGYHRLEGDAAKGHTPGNPATCTTPQTCTKCGAVLENAMGHDYKGEATAPNCEKMGYTTFTCSRCGDSYKGEYADATGHKMSDWITDKEPTTDSEGSRHKECESCGKTLETESTPKLYLTATTDTHGEAIVGGYLVIVTDTDTKNPISGAAVALDKAGGISIRLPNSRLLDYADQTTVTVLLSKDKTPVLDMQLTVTDKNTNYCADKTDKAGRITVPGTSGSTNDDGKTTGGYEDADGEHYTLTVKVEDYETGRPIEGADVSIGKTGKITVTLPAGVDMDEHNRITVTVTDRKKQPQEGLTVLVKGDLKQTAESKTDKNGKLTVPAVAVTVHHGAYIYGYPDGTFGGSRGMTRSEAAAIFGRLLADKNGDTVISAARTKFADVPANSWYAGYVQYLTGYGIVYGCGNDRFDPDRAITRAEFTAMAVRFFNTYGEGSDELMEKYSGFDDVSSGYWAAEYIKDAALHGWIFGYGDGTFRGERSITRAEVVAIVNRLLGRTADEEYITANLRRLNTFTDMDKGHWAYYDVMEAANSHSAVMTDTEEWGG